MLVTSGANFPLIASCHKTPKAFSFRPFIDPPTGAKASLSNIIGLQNLTTFSPWILSNHWPVWLNGWVFVSELTGCGFESSCSYLNIITFCISTETTSSSSSHFLSFLFLCYLNMIYKKHNHEKCAFCMFYFHHFLY